LVYPLGEEGVMFILRSLRTVLALFLGVCLLLLASSTSSSVNQGGVRYVIDAKASKFFAHGLRGGLFWFKGHEHVIQVKEFSGEASVTPGSILPAALQVTAQAGSLEETSSAFTQQQKEIINKELREIVFHPEQYPEISFRSTAVELESTKGGEFEVEIKGNLTLHGVTRQIEVPAKVTMNGDTLRAVGKFTIDRGDFKVKATSAFHGLVRVRSTVRLEFDVVARRG
jgi:polyisoprenoid-binding protein YceI